MVRVHGGRVTDGVSLPLGVLRIGAIREKGRGALQKRVAALVKDAGWAGRGKGLPLYMVGGSWRALARLDMHLLDYPLPVVHGYVLEKDRVAALDAIIADASKTTLKAVPNLSGGRVPTLGDAAALLRVVMGELGVETAIASTYGLREGLLYQTLSAAERGEDPLIVAAREEGARLGRFAEHGDLLADWIAPLFADEPADCGRLRHVACLLGDVGWNANPEFRAERGVEIALHGHWVGIDAAGRAAVAQALSVALGGGDETPAPLGTLADTGMLAQARRWGLAIRLGHRLSGGLAAPLSRSSLSLGKRDVVLSLRGKDRAGYGEAVEKRHKALAAAFDRAAVVEG